MTKRSSVVDGAPESELDLTFDGNPLMLDEDAATGVVTNWGMEIAELKGKKYGTVEEAVADITDIVIKKLKLPATVELKKHLMESLIDDDVLQEVIAQELGVK